MLPLGIECVGDYPSRDRIAGLIRSADSDDRDFRKASSNNREKLESRHLRHVEIADDNVWGRMLKLHVYPVRMVFEDAQRR